MLVKNPLEPHPWDHLPEWDWSPRLARILMVDLDTLYEFFGLAWCLLLDSRDVQIWGQLREGVSRIGLCITRHEDEDDAAAWLASVVTLSSTSRQPHEEEFVVEAEFYSFAVGSDLGDSLLAVEAAFHSAYNQSRDNVLRGPLTV